jgi:hypothetical protein
MTKFFIAKPIVSPEDVRASLADPEKHWRKGYSAFELATSWISAGDFPPPVRKVLDANSLYLRAQFIEGFFERQVDLRTPGRSSQTDLMVLARLAQGFAIIAVEGKVRESFGPIVDEWNTSPGKSARLKHLCEVLGAPMAEVGRLRYQLFHRVASALFEAERYGAAEAMMLVHSFSDEYASLADYQNFANALGITGAEINAVSNPRIYEAITLRLAWVVDRPA